jgi:hypothetical protein
MAETNDRSSRTLAIIGAVTGILGAATGVAALSFSIYTWSTERKVDLRVDLQRSGDVELVGRKYKERCYFVLTVRNPTSFAVEVSEVWLEASDELGRYRGHAKVFGSGPSLPIRLQAHDAESWEFGVAPGTWSREYFHTGRVIEASERRLFVSAPIRGGGEFSPQCANP